MIITAYPQAAAPNILQIWVGLFDVDTLPALQFRINGAPQTPVAAPTLTPIRDGATTSLGRPRNHRCVVQFPVPQADRAYTVEILAGDESHQLVTRTLPEAVPSSLDGSFNILLSSCYSQPEDGGGLLGRIVAELDLEPHLTLLAGDQVYLDLPLFEDLPESELGMARALGEKYRRNWASRALGVPGLEAVLRRAPAVCIPDDHEYWNNFPFKQKQLPNTWNDAVRERWRKVARELFDDYQGPDAPGAPATIGARRIDVAPLKMLFVDMRTHREADLNGTLMHQQTLTALSQWERDLLDARDRRQPAVGVLASGQALFMNAAGPGKAESIDAEIADYSQSRALYGTLTRLADATVAVLYLTGDVHWGRVAKGVDATNNRPLLYEVISSPSRLISVPFVDAGKEVLDRLGGIFHRRAPWPRHSQAQDVPDRFAGTNRWRLSCEHGQRGDQIAVVSFTRAGTGVDFQATYYGIHVDKTLSRPQPTASFALRVG